MNSFEAHIAPLALWRILGTHKCLFELRFSGIKIAAVSLLV
jgi:hypothetical protein